MNIYLNSLTINNLRSIVSDKIFLFGQAQLSILDGPNGYGKSTVFDAIELLITGKISHFNEKLKNRGDVDFKIVANSPHKPTVISAEFAIDEQFVTVLRTFDWTNNNQYITLIKDGEKKNIDDAELYGLLNISKNIFDVGMYISQSESLDFLEKKYKERKDILTSILDVNDILEKSAVLKEIRDEFKKEQLKISSVLHNVLETKIQYREELKKQLDIDQSISIFTEYKQLFPGRGVEFDKKNINLKFSCEGMLTELKEIMNFITKYDEFKIVEKNNLIQECIDIPETIYKAYFYRHEIIDIHSNLEYYENLKKMENIKSKESITISDIENKLIKIEFNETCESLSNIFKEKVLLEKNVKMLDMEVTKLQMKREELKNIHEHQEVLGQNQCPFCGEKNLVIQDSYDNITEFINFKVTEEQKQLNNLNREWIVASNRLKAEIEKFLESEKEKLSIFKEIENLLQVKTNSVLKLEFIKDMTNFKFINENGENNNYEYFYDSLMKFLLTEKSAISDNALPENISIYKKIETSYFNNEKPVITPDQINEKILYVKNQYANKLAKEAEKIDTDIKKIQDYMTHQEETENEVTQYELLNKLYKAHNDAYKDYQSDFIESIKVPLHLISGRIIQTYQLGVGVFADIKDNQVIFKAPRMNKGSDEDIFNILSVGQLNGVMLSILFSIRKVFSKSNELNLILIDDPLQSIDDISIHSFADLLSEEFPHTQMIFSTHEADKTQLLKYKFNQMNRVTQSFNMQTEYLEM